MSKANYEALKLRAGEFLALTGLTVDEFEKLITHFDTAFQAHMAKWCVNGQLRTKRRYTPYKNCPLASAEERLLFVTSYVKGNPLQSAHGTMFGMAQSQANLWLHVLLPVLRETFRTLGLAPSRSIGELAERLALQYEGGGAAECEAALPLFVMMAPNDASSAPRMQQISVRAIAARNIRTR